MYDNDKFCTDSSGVDINSETKKWAWSAHFTAHIPYNEKYEEVGGGYIDSAEPNITFALVYNLFWFKKTLIYNSYWLLLYCIINLFCILASKQNYVNFTNLLL